MTVINRYLRYLLLIPMLILPLEAVAIPNITTEFARNIEGLMRVKVINQTARVLACYVAIDGHKIKFKLGIRAHSRWYKALNKNYNADSFSVWCDYIELHPDYQNLKY
ncbi:hypothetical protein [Colwellia sp. MEBiC06753]